MKFKVEKMMCGGCTANVTAKLEALDAVEQVTVDLASGTATVEGEIDPDTIIDVLSKAGYPTALLTETDE